VVRFLDGPEGRPRSVVLLYDIYIKAQRPRVRCGDAHNQRNVRATVAGACSYKLQVQESTQAVILTPSVPILTISQSNKAPSSMDLPIRRPHRDLCSPPPLAGPEREAGRGAGASELSQCAWSHLARL
jgi:hypothetical protein